MNTSVFPSRIYLYHFLLITLILFFTVVYVHLEQKLYYFDYGYYWRLFGTFGNVISDGNWVIDALHQIRSDDYSPAPIIPLYPFYEFFGSSRTVYIYGVSVLYLFPTALIAAQISRKLGVNSYFIVTILSLLYTPFWVPTLRGLPDIIGCIFLGLSTWLLFSSDFLRRRALWSGLLLGILIWLPFLFRRWYAYSILAFFLTAYAIGLFHNCKTDRAWGAVRFSSVMFLAGIVSLLLVFLFQKDLAYRAITTDYSTLYDAYQVTFGTHVALFYARTGVFVLAMIIAGLVMCTSEYRLRLLFCFFASTLTIIIFSRTQFLGPQHYLPVAFWYFPIYAVGILKIIGFRKKYEVLDYSILILPVMVFFAGLTGVTDVSRATHRSIIAENLLGQYSFQPLRIENFKNYEKLTADIERLTHQGDQVAVFASSEQLSYSLLTAINPAIAPVILETPQRDRDGIVMLSALNADFVVWSSPDQTHLAPGSQTIVTLPNEMLRENRGFGSAFNEVGEYALAGGIKAFLAKRTRPVTVAEMEAFLGEFFIARPDMKSIIQHSMRTSFENRTDVLGDVYGTVSLADDNTIYMHPGVDKPTSTIIPFIGERPASIDLSIPATALETCPTADGVEATVHIDDMALPDATILPGGTPIRIVVPAGAKKVGISIQKRSTPLCDGFTAAFKF